MEVTKEKKTQYNDLGNPNPWKTIFKLALPAMLAQAIVVLYSIVDRIYVSNMPENGKLALIGIGVCAPIGTLACSFAFLAGLGAAPLFSMSLGEKREENAKKIMAHTFFMLLILGITTTIIFYSAITPILKTFGASAINNDFTDLTTPSSFKFAHDYLIYYLIGNIFYTICLGLNQLIIAEGKSVVGMATILIGCVLNIALDPLFIYTLNMGTKGAAIATIISQFCSFLFVMWYVIFKSPVKLSFKEFKYEGIIVKKILKLGVTPWLVLASDSFTIIALNAVLQKYGGQAYGDSYIAVATIVVAFLSLVTGPLLGISSGTQPALGYNFGAKNIDLIKKLEIDITILAVGYCALWFGLSFVVGEPFAKMFASGGIGAEDAAFDIIEVATKYIKIYSIGLIPLAFQYVLVDGLTGMGQARYSVWLSMFRKVLLIVLAIVIPLIMKQENGQPNGLTAFYAEPISDIAAAITTTSIYLFITPKILEKQKNNTSKKDILYQ